MKILLLVICSSILLASCGGGGGGGGGGTANSSIPASTSTSNSTSSALNADVTPPAASIMFPTAVSMTESDKVLVRGVASDDKNKVSSLKVNGYAVSTTDDYANWQVEVPLSLGTNTLSISTGDSVGNISSNAAEVKIIRKIFMSAPLGLGVDAANNRAIVVDAGLKAIIAVDLNTGIRSIVSDNLRNDSSPFSNPVCMTLDIKNNRALILDDGFGVKALVSVNLSTGQRTTIATYPSQYSWPTAIALDELKNRVLFTADQSVVGIDLASGSFAVVSDHSTPGRKYYFNHPKGIAIDTKNNRALVTDSGSGSALVSVDLTAGPTYGVSTPVFTRLDNSMGELILSSDKSTAFIANNSNYVEGGSVTAVNIANRTETVLSNSQIPSALPAMTGLSSLALDEAHNRILVIDTYEKSILTVGLSSGQRSVLSDNSLHTGDVSYRTPLSLVLDDTNNLLLMDEEPSALYSINRNTSIRSTISSVKQNHGLNNYHGMVLDKARNRTLIADSLLGGIVSIDMTSGERTMFWSGSGSFVPYPFGVVLDSTKNKIWVVEAHDCLISIDLISGTSSLLSNNTTPNADNPMTCMSRIALDAAHNRLLSAEAFYRSIIAIDLTTGNRTILSNNSVPDTSNPFLAPNAIAIDVSRNRALVLDSLERIIAVDLSNGKRTLIHSAISQGDPYASAIEIDEVNNVAFLIDSAQGAVVAVDLVTGNRVIFSK